VSLRTTDDNTAIQVREHLIKCLQETQYTQYTANMLDENFVQSENFCFPVNYFFIFTSFVIFGVILSVKNGCAVYTDPVYPLESDRTG